MTDKQSAWNGDTPLDRQRLKSHIRTVPDWPQPGVRFRDLSTLFEDPEIFRGIISSFERDCRKWEIDLIGAVDARGFIIGGALACLMGKPLLLVRKKGKLPHQTISEDYVLEYGRASVEIHADACHPGDRVLLVDDLIATGGTLLAAAKLFRSLGGVVAGAAAIVDLPELGGSEKLEAAGVPVLALCQFKEDE